jgi:cation diffusion facilitator CzcD-associated flavoprotein CzcO
VTHHQVVVAGGGPAGLAVSRELQKRGVDYVTLERHHVGYSWERLYDGLTLHTGKKRTTLPDLPFPKEVPHLPTRDDFVAYLKRYAKHFALNVVEGCDVKRAWRDGDVWRVEAGCGAYTCDVLVMSVGEMTNPRIPAWPDREKFPGTVIHAIDYKNPAPYRGRRVLVVGGGGYAAHVAVEVQEGGAARVAVSIRSGVETFPLTILGMPTQYVSVVLRSLPDFVGAGIEKAFLLLDRAFGGPPVLPPKPPGNLTQPVMGFHLVDAVKAGKIDVRRDVERFTETGVLFRDGAREDFDDVIFATGFLPATGVLQADLRRNQYGGPLCEHGVKSLDHPKLYFVFHRYDTAPGGVYNIAEDAVVAGRLIAEELTPPARRSS